LFFTGFLAMMLDLKVILEETEVNEVLERDWWHPDENGSILGISTPLHVSIKVTRVGDKFLLDGKMSGGIMVRCDRCLDSFHRHLESGFHVSLASLGQEKDRAEVELLDEDMEVDFIHGETIDLDEIIKEQVYLSLPMKSICKEGCLGLCPICGANRNVDRCQCDQQYMNPAFEKLKNLKLEGE
jgi:uncharacterized protein